MGWAGHVARNGGEEKYIDKIARQRSEGKTA